jgi:UDP-2,3-diacylglucosamine pyrophosphatase LpxH
MEIASQYGDLVGAQPAPALPLTGGLRARTRALSARIERTKTYRGLDEAVRRGLHISDFSLSRDRYIIFSDLHRGSGQKNVDDFLHNRDVYCHALSHYLGQDYRLVLNGDVEEGWKTNYRTVSRVYADTAVAAEREFASLSSTHYLRVYGNHDDALANPLLVRRYLGPVFGAMNVHPAIVLGGRIVIAHGHQGDFYSDRYAWLSRKAVRYGWRPIQRITGLELNHDAENSARLSARDHHLSAWARDNGLLLICGHTHRPHFPTPASGAALPYLNDGACVHSDGITGIEIEGGEIRLIKWQLRSDAAQRSVLQSYDLGRILHANAHLRDRARACHPR